MRQSLFSNRLHSSLLAGVLNEIYFDYPEGSTISTYYRDDAFTFYTNSTCECKNNVSCSAPVGHYRNNTFSIIGRNFPSSEGNIAGLLVGCYTMEGLLRSALECFFDATCLQMIFDYILVPNSSNFNPLDISRTQYATLTTVEVLSDNAFVENWTAQISFEKYFTECAPSACIYTYQQHDNLLFILTSLLGLYGGLIAVLRFLHPLLIGWWRKRSIRTANPAVCKYTKKCPSFQTRFHSFTPVSLDIEILLCMSLVMDSYMYAK